MDIVGPLPVTREGHKYTLMFQDSLSKYYMAVPISQQDVETIARVFVEEAVLTFGIPQVIWQIKVPIVSVNYSKTCVSF
jgi:uncharacterized protein (UPF0254 family)